MKPLITNLRYCAAPACSNKVTRGYCRQHAVAREHQRYNYDTRRWYRTMRWRRLRQQVLSAEPLCRSCLHTDSRITEAREIDHITPHRNDPTLFWARDNLQPLCASCHAKKTAAGG